MMGGQKRQLIAVFHGPQVFEERFRAAGLVSDVGAEQAARFSRTESSFSLIGSMVEALFQENSSGADVHPGGTYVGLSSLVVVVLLALGLCETL